MTKEQVAAGLELVVKQGLSIAQAARELKVPRHALFRWLEKEPAYQEHCELKKSKAAANLEKVLQLAGQGLNASVIALEVGLNEGTVLTWLKSAWIEAAPTTTLSCPACGESMEQEALYFWSCQCGAEWWPSDETVPEDIEEWSTGARVRPDGGEAAQAMAARLYGPRVDSFDRPKTERLVRAMAGTGFTSRVIAERLNAEGLTNSRGAPWTRAGVQFFCKRMCIPLRGPEAVPRTGDGGVHPWRKDESIRYAQVKARGDKYGKLSNMPNSDGNQK